MSEAQEYIVIVGSGIAGLSAAMAATHAFDGTNGADADAAHRPHVIMVCKENFTESNTYHAQGGIAAAIFPDDDPALHTQDTLAAGDGLCDPKAVGVLTAEGKTLVNELVARGVRFDRDADGNLLRGLEAAHSRARVVHAGGDATGKIVELDVSAMVKNNPAIEILEHTFVTDLVIGPTGRCEGVRCVRRDEEDTVESFTIPATRVILASGGAGQMYPYTTNPAVATADGTAAAVRAGAQVADLEFYQFHPTALALEDNFLVSEAVRGEGAQLFNEKGERYMTAVDPRAELAPRDVVARENFRQMMAQDGRPVFLDARPIGEKHPDMPLAEFLARRFPTIDAYVREHGFDWSQTPIPITPAAHYYMGGIRTDYTGRTSIPGLWAAGECARTGVHGANRLASNSLLEGLVYGHRAGCDAAQFDTDAPEETAWWHPGPLDPAWDGETVNSDTPRSLDMSTTGPSPASDESADGVRARIERTMWTRMGVLRDADGITAGIAELRAELGEAQAALAAARPATPGIEGADYPTYITLLENVNLATVGLAAAQAALARTESRGAHAREDYPQTDPVQAHSVAWVVR